MSSKEPKSPMIISLTQTQTQTPIIETPKLTTQTNLSAVDELLIINKYISANYMDLQDKLNKINGRSLKFSKHLTGLSHSYLIINDQMGLLVLRLSHSTESPNKSFFNSETVGLIGEGGFGKVKRLDTEHGSKFVIKSIACKSPHSLSEQKKVTTEAEQELAMLLRAGLLYGYYSYTNHKGQIKINIIMPNLGVDLFTYFEQAKKNNWRYDDEFIIDLFMKCFIEIRRLHELGIAHRDIKLQNMMINPKTLEVKLTDFGLAIDKSLAPSEVVGHLSAIPPEQFAAHSLHKPINLTNLSQLISKYIPNKTYLSKFISQTSLQISRLHCEQTTSGKEPIFCTGEQLDIFALGRLFEELIRIMKQTTGINSELSAKLEPLYSDMIHPNPKQRLTNTFIILKTLLVLDEQIKTRIPSISSTKQPLAVLCKTDRSDKKVESSPPSFISARNS